MTTTFTRAAGTIAYLTAALWLFTGVTGALITQADALDQTWSNPAVNVLVVLAMIATTTVVAGMLVRSGGVGDVPAFAALALMILATLLMAVAPWAWVVTAVPLAGAAVIAVRALPVSGWAEHGQTGRSSSPGPPVPRSRSSATHFGSGRWTSTAATHGPFSPDSASPW